MLDDLDENWKVHLKLIEKYPTGKASKFFHKCIDALVGQKGPDYDQFWLPTEWWDLRRAWSEFFLKAINQPENTNKLLAHLAEDYKVIASDVLDMRQNEIKNFLLNGTCSTMHAHLAEFDWRLQLSLSSDKVANLCEPLLTLDLNICEDQEERSTSVEMNKDELNVLISSLETVMKALLPLKT